MNDKLPSHPITAEAWYDLLPLGKPMAFTYKGERVVAYKSDVGKVEITQGGTLITIAAQRAQSETVPGRNGMRTIGGQRWLTYTIQTVGGNPRFNANHISAESVVATLAQAYEGDTNKHEVVDVLGAEITATIERTRDQLYSREKTSMRP